MGEAGRAARDRWLQDHLGVASARTQASSAPPGGGSEDSSGTPEPDASADPSQPAPDSSAPPPDPTSGPPPTVQAGAPTPAVAPSNEQQTVAVSTPGIPLATVTITASLFTVRIQVTATFAGNVQLNSGPTTAGRTNTDSATFDGGLVRQIGETWYQQQGRSLLGLPSSITQVSLSAQTRTANGIEASIQATFQGAGGWSGSISFRVIRVDNAGHLDGPGATVSASPPALQIAHPFDHGTLNASVQFALAGTVEPNWPAILERMGAEAAIDTAGAGTAARTVTVALDAATLIPAALIAGAAVTLYSTYRGIEASDAPREAGNAVGVLSHGLANAFVAGATLADTPSNPAFLGAYRAGQDYLEQYAGEQHILPDEAASRLQGQLTEWVGRAERTVMPQAQQAIWTEFASQHRGDTSTLRNIYRAVFQDAPSDSEIARYGG